ncbi:MAG TPA: FHA domain-containing protein [Gammaproteobacteria bacterium]|nr:FHA domain-containing protein [Gammaproteobacteria bacterium]
MSSKEAKDRARADRLEELALALKEAQLMLLEQSNRFETLTKNESESGRGLTELQQQLATVTAERDQLQKQLLALERMQTATVALPEDREEEPPVRRRLPSIDELMAARSALTETTGGSSRGRLRRLNGPLAEAPVEADWGEMIAPEVIAPEEFGAEEAAGKTTNKRTSKLLIMMDSEPPTRIPLHEGTMTVGRSESAHIRLDGEYVSRIHARIVCRGGEAVVEDAGSKNGFKVNSIAVRRHMLSHGDVITIGKFRFTFVDIKHRS